MTLGALFLIFEGIGSRLEFRWFSRDSLGDPRSREPSQWRVTRPSRGVVNNQLRTFWLSNTSFKAVSWRLTGSEGFARL